MAYPDWTVDTFAALTASDCADALARTVLVVTDELDGVAEVGETLIGLGYRVQVAVARDGAVRGMPEGAPDAVLLCLNRYLADAKPLVRALKRHLAAPLVPFIGYLAPHDIMPEGFDSILIRPAHKRQIAGRVDATIRLQAMQHEYLRRTQVLRLAFDEEHRLAPDALGRQLRVLFIGTAKPDFTVVLNALRARNAEVTAAFTSFTAFDYLHGREFDAVIVDAVESSEPAASILESMGRNVRLHHVPKVVLVGEGGRSDVPKALLEKATDVISADCELAELTGRVLEPASFHLVHSQLRAEFGGIGGGNVRDPDTGLYGKAYIDAYLDFLQTEGEARTVCEIKLSPSAGFAVAEPFVRVAMAQAGGLLSGLVRVNDLVARTGFDSFSIAVAPMAADHLAGMCERVENVIECAAFESGVKGGGPFTLTVDVRVVGDRKEAA